MTHTQRVGASRQQLGPVCSHRCEAEDASSTSSKQMWAPQPPCTVPAPGNEPAGERGEGEEGKVIQRHLMGCAFGHFSQQPGRRWPGPHPESGLAPQGRALRWDGYWRGSLSQGSRRLSHLPLTPASHT